ncbi:T9SS type A sorting domain-containing protein [Chryseobacterium sp. YIM B08800]|uniref:T9SS type A sorting domain-containing protein n=1 Tax=Chryseobacterium sp. YIM B08800 TaxID=2984136 RepID=UPI00223F84E3|nr:T9SS type A sorting domain-containing protein [Chryseobacterium sp. YIM B08800]
MKKNLLTIGVLAIGLSVQAQVLLHVDDTAKMYVSNGTLVYNGGGLQTRGTGNVDLHGNMMVVGSGSDVVKTINTDASNKADGSNIIVRINDTANPVSSSYGQLYIKGIAQGNITGVVDKEYACTKHGAYQQIGIPFMGKTFSSLSTDLAGNFNNSRWQGREILKWSNADRRFDGSIIPSAPITSASTAGITIDVNSAVTTVSDRTAYYTLGTATMNPATLHTIKGTPYADGISGGNTMSLSPSSVPATFGAGGNNRNIYQEKYNTYIYDPFDNAIPWNTTTTTFGRFFYQFSNPYLTNIDLSMIGITEAGAVNDNNAFANIWGVAIDPQNVTYNTTTGGTSSYAGSQMVTFDSNQRPTGNITALIVKPLGTFKIKLRNSTPQQMDFDNLRRFSSIPRAEGTSYSVTAAKNITTGSIKQLGVLALDANGNQIGETYYVVAPQFTTGNLPDASISSVQAMTNTSAIIQTFEETANGDIDQNYSSTYRLYINEANEVDYLGKKINLSIFGQNISSLKFEIRDNVDLVPNGTHVLSGGTGFYYTVANGQAVQIKQGDIIPVTNSSYGLYYGAPQVNGTLNTNDVKPLSRTLVVYNPSIDDYIVRFDPSWKSASIEVFDASGKLVISEKSVKADADYVIKLDSAIKAAYVVKVVGNDGSTVNTKILIK